MFRQTMIDMDVTSYVSLNRHLVCVTRWYLLWCLTQKSDRERITDRRYWEKTETKNKTAKSDHWSKKQERGPTDTRRCVTLDLHPPETEKIWSNGGLPECLSHLFSLNRPVFAWFRSSTTKLCSSVTLYVMWLQLQPKTHRFSRYAGFTIESDAQKKMWLISAKCGLNVTLFPI